MKWSKIAVVAALFSAWLAIDPVLAAPNDSPTVVKCTKKFRVCIRHCDRVFNGNHNPANRNCRNDCDDRILACEEQPD